MNGGEFGVYYRPELAVARVATARRRITSRLVGLGISLAIFAGAFVAFPDLMREWWLWFLVPTLVIESVVLSVSAFLAVRARRDAGQAGEGLALGINRDGLLVAGAWFPWPEIGSLEVKPASWGTSPRLTVTGRSAARAEVLLDYIDVRPASIDSAIRALSGGRAWVDLSRLDD